MERIPVNYEVELKVAANYDYEKLLEDWQSLGNPNKTFIQWFMKKYSLTPEEVPKDFWLFLTILHIW